MYRNHRDTPRFAWPRRHVTLRADVVIFALFAAALLMMPVYYNAGTARDHPHAIFQGMIDAVLGHTHQHADDARVATDGSGMVEPAPARAAVSPFMPANIPLATSSADAGREPTSTDPVPGPPDTPKPLPGASSIVAVTAILMLGALVLGLLTERTSFPLWSIAQRLTACPLAVESPPPRQAS